MARDLAEQERAFIDALSAETGRDLMGWLDAIRASGHTARNDIIDWLRHQGFTFSNASWLERIHHNGGRLIYGGIDLQGVAMPNVTRTRASAAATPAAGLDGSWEASAAPRRASLAPPEIRPNHAETTPAHDDTRGTATPSGGKPHHGASDDDVAALLLAAKGLRPLAELVLREMDGVIPGLTRSIDGPLVVMASPEPVAALLPAPKDVRLYADFGPQARDRAKKADTARAGPLPYPDMLVLNDARQIDARFRELVALAYTRALK